MRLRLRPVMEDDFMLLFKWANDPLTRRMSFDTTPISLEDHKKWFNNLLDHQSTQYLFIVEGNKSNNWFPIAQVRFDENGEISVLLAKEFRGKQLAARVIRVGIDYIQRELPLEKIVAHIKPENIASVKAFERAGFRFTRETTVKCHPCLEYIYNIVK